MRNFSMLSIRFPNQLTTFLFAVVLLLGTPATAQDLPYAIRRFTPHEANPVFTGQPGEWDALIRERGWIMKDGDQFRMWYTGYNPDQQPLTMKLGYATSPDGIKWTRHPQNPVFDDVWVEDMMVVKRNNAFTMFAEGAGDVAQMLRSKDGIRWKRIGALDVRLTNGEKIPEGPYGTPTAVVKDGVWHLFYERRDQGIWLATSKDQKTWTNVSNDPVILPGPGGYDKLMIAMNQIVRRNGRWYAVMHGTGSPTKPRDWCTYFAVSDDLRTWSKCSEGPVFPVAENKSSGVLVHDGEQFRLYTMHGKVALHLAKAKSKPPVTPAPKKTAPFRWVNHSSKLPVGVTHGTFTSPSMKLDVGYCVYLPSDYSAEASATKRYPVVYYLHGGRPGSELKSVKLATHLHEHIETGAVAPMIYVFVNGGPVSHYNMPDRENAMGEDVFVDELIPHIDRTYRTIARRVGRGLEGFSQGGRGTTRIMFKHSRLFGSAAPGGAGHETERLISENNGRESETLVFTPGYNTYDLAREYAKSRTPSSPKLPILFHVGTKGFNYENNLAYMKFLDELKIPYSRLVVEDVPHSAIGIYEKRGLELMKFHAKNFGLE